MKSEQDKIRRAQISMLEEQLADELSKRKAESMRHELPGEDRALLLRKNPTLSNSHLEFLKISTRSIIFLPTEGHWLPVFVTRRRDEALVSQDGSQARVRAM